jgi:calcineurin-like phosphoesterase family protein
MNFFTSDLHLGHANIIKYCSRPFDTVEEMNNNIINNINKKVTTNDTLWILGDVVMGNRDENLKLLNKIAAQNIIIVSGNHDLWHPLYGRKSEDRINECMKLTGATIIPTHTKLEIKNLKFNLSHFPYTGESREGRPDRYVSWRLVDDGNWLLCGHVHSAWRQENKIINVGLDAWGGQVVSESEILELVRNGTGSLPIIEWK